MDVDSLSCVATLNPPSDCLADASSGKHSREDGRGEYEPPAKKPAVKLHALSNGFIRFRPGSNTAEKMAIRQQRERATPDMIDKLPKIVPNTWLFFNDMVMGNAVQLYGSQALRLFKNLPHAYKAFLKGDTSYYFLLDETKTQKLTLEVHTYNEKTYVSLKKYFKPEDKADDPRQDWVATGHFVSFNPIDDDPQDMLDFVLMSNEK